MDDSNHQYFFEKAGEIAKKALCLRDKCGAVIVLDEKIIGEGFNAPPNNDIGQRMCLNEYKTSLKPKSDKTCCVHAEWRAILDALKKNGDISGSTLYFSRLDSKDNMKRSGQPYCTVCSRLAFDTGVKYFGLWHEAGIKLYDTKEYNILSYNFYKDENKSF